MIRNTGKITTNNSVAKDDLMTILRRRKEQKEHEDIPNRPLLYSERKDGVIIEGNPRADQWDVAQAAHDYIARTKLARRDAFDKGKAEAAKAEAAAKAAAMKGEGGPGGASS